MLNVLPVICQGFCSLVQVSQECDTIPGMLNFTTDDVAKKNGWTYGKCPKFSRDGYEVWLCPDCAKRWQTERRQMVEHLFDLKRDLSVARVSGKIPINTAKKQAEGLTIEFCKYGPSYEEWSIWYSI